MNIIQAFEKLISINEKFKKRFHSEIEEWEPEEPPITCVMSAFGEEVLSHSTELTDEEYTIIFSCVEYLLKEGDETVKNAVMTGFLETLMHLSKENKPARFTFFIGEVAKKYCIAWDSFTGVETLGLYGATGPTKNKTKKGTGQTKGTPTGY